MSKFFKECNQQQCVLREITFLVVVFEWTQAEEASESSLYTELSLGCLFDGVVNQPHFFLA